MTRNRLWAVLVALAAVIGLGFGSVGPALAYPGNSNVYGGDLMQAPVNASYGILCTAGIPAQSARGIRYIITAGHCVGGDAWGKTWKDTSGYNIGYGVRASFGTRGTDPNGWDMGVISSNRSSNSSVRSTSAVYYMNGYRSPYLNETNCIPLGRTLRTQCMTVYAVNQHVTTYDSCCGYQVIYNLAFLKSSDSAGCPQPGDSGSPSMASRTLTGILVTIGHDTATRQCLVGVSQMGGAFAYYDLYPI